MRESVFKKHNEVNKMKLNEIIKTSGLSDEKQIALKSSFEEYAKIAEEWKVKADLIVIKDENDLVSMKEADNARKILKTKRVEVEHKRKELKEASLKEGKLIDSIANELKGLIEPIETSLLEKSKFAENLRKEKEEALRVKRNAEIDPLSEFVPYGLDFGVMPEEEYVKVLNGAKLQLEQKIEAERIAEEERLEIIRIQEEERIAKEKAEAEERERMRKENEALKAKQELGIERRIALKDAYKFVPADEDLSELTDEEYKEIAQQCYAQLEAEYFHIEQERIEREKKEKELEAEREKVRLENERKEEELRQARYNTEMKEKEKQALILKQKQEEEERLRIQREEEEAKKLEEERIKNASDKEKLIIFRDQLRAVKKPNVDSEKAIDLLISIRHELVNIYQIIDDFEVI